MKTTLHPGPWTFSEINECTGAFNGDPFASELEVYDYFNLAALRQTFGPEFTTLSMRERNYRQDELLPMPTDAEEQDELDRMANAVIYDRWSCAF